MDENKLLSLPQCSGTPEARIPTTALQSRNCRIVKNGRVTLMELDQGQRQAQLSFRNQCRPLQGQWTGPRVLCTSSP